MSDGGTSDPHLRRRLERVRGTWNDEEPLVLVFSGKTTPIVAHVAGEWRYLSDRLHRPRVADRLDLEVAAYRRGLPSVEPLSTHADRLAREAFEAVPEADSDVEPSDCEEPADTRRSAPARAPVRDDSLSVDSEAALTTDGGEPRRDRTPFRRSANAGRETMTNDDAPPIGRFSDYGASPGNGRECLNCGAHLTGQFVRVFEPDRQAGARACPNCTDLIRDVTGTIRRPRAPTVSHDRGQR